MQKHHHIIIVPGLSDILFPLATKRWHSQDVTVHPFPLGWRSAGEWDSKLQKLICKVDSLTSDTNLVSLVGTSAGGSAVLNTLLHRPQAVHRIVNICGRLRAGENVRPTLEYAARTSKAFHQSVLVCEKAQENMSPELRAKVLTLRPLLDEVVPLSTMTLDGADNRKMNTIEHSLSIMVGLITYRKTILRFVTNNKE